MAEKRLLALGDILGFKHTIKTIPLETVVEQYFGFFRKALQHTLHQQGWPETSEDFTTLKTAARVGIEWFSDTIIIYGNDDTDDAARNVLQVSNWLLFETMYVPALRLRFGIAYDELYVSKNAGQLVGKAVVCAHELEKNQKWAGGALTNEAAARVHKDSRCYTIAYNVPLKEPAPASDVAMNWTQGAHVGFRVRFAPDRAEPNERDPDDIAEKWRNTMAFHENVCRGCRKQP